MFHRLQEGIHCSGHGPALTVSENHDDLQRGAEGFNRVIIAPELLLAKNLPRHTHHEELIAGMIEDQFCRYASVRTAEDIGKRLLTQGVTG